MFLNTTVVLVEDGDRSKIGGLVANTPIPDLGSELVVAVTAVTHGDRIDHIARSCEIERMHRCVWLGHLVLPSNDPECPKHTLRHRALCKMDAWAAWSARLGRAI